MTLIQIIGYEVQDRSGELLGPLLMNSNGRCYVLHIGQKEAFPISDFPDCKIIKL